MEKCLEIFFNQSKAQAKNKNSSQGQYPQYNDIKGGSRDEKLVLLEIQWTLSKDIGIATIENIRDAIVGKLE